MKHTPISRREFLKNIGMTGAGVLLAASPWLSAFSEAVNTSNEKCRLGIIGPGSRGRFLMSFLVQNPKVDIVALEKTLVYGVLLPDPKQRHVAYIWNLIL